MREALFVLAFVLILAALTAIRYRRQITAAIQVWKILRGATELRKDLGAAPSAIHVENTSLVSCAKCGRWVRDDQSIRLGRNHFYCSSRCLDRKAVG